MGSKCSTEETTPPMTPVGCASPVVPSPSRTPLHELFPQMKKEEKEFKNYQVKSQSKNYDDTNHIRWGTALHQGSKPEMEDVLTFKGNSKSGEKYNFFGIYDGHCGTDTVDYVNENLCKNFFNDPSFPSDIELALKNSFLKTDVDFEKHYKDGSGSTAVTLIVSNNKLYFANIGDSIAIISKLSKKGEAEIMTQIHRPTKDNKDEIDRIRNACPTIQINGGRIQNGLSVSRAFGDFGLKKFSNYYQKQCNDNSNIVFNDDVVSNVPAVNIMELNDDVHFCIITSDGLTDLFQPNFLVKCVYEELDKGNLNADEIAKNLINHATRLIPTYLMDFNTPVVDNLSIIIVFFNQL